MKVQGSTDPGLYSICQLPNTNRSLIRLYQNVRPVETEDFTGYEYDEYHVEAITWDGLEQNVQDNFDAFLKQGMENEIDKSNGTLYNSQKDSDAMLVDQEFRLTMLELGITA